MLRELDLWVYLKHDNIMRTIILLCGLILVTISAYSQDTVYVKGYYIERYSKSEVLSKKQNDDLKAKGKSYETMIDYKMQPFFFTLKVNSDIKLMKIDEIESILCLDLDYKNVEIFKFPPFNNKMRSYFDNLNIQIKNVEFGINQNYYTSEKDSVHFYKLYSVEGHALRIKLDNDYLNTKTSLILATEWDIVPIVNKNIPSFYVYLFYDCNIINPIFPLRGFIKWSSN